VLIRDQDAGKDACVTVIPDCGSRGLYNKAALVQSSDVAELYELIGPQLRQESGAEKSYTVLAPLRYLKQVDESGS
jgi:hypothetical protein